ncbi:MAG: Ferrous iron transport periplasmic protein, partial [Solirubrobacterales bacterium]|nr:Ferrous iron transport periplasmic protein [Solirubrobacterales bacterium]
MNSMSCSPARALLAGGCALLAATTIAACGSDSGSSTTGSSGSSTTGKAAAKELKFQLTDSGCTPSDATVEAGAVKISVVNPGSTKTDEIELKNADGIIMGERENLAPGLGSDFTLTLQPGTYVLNCTFQNDARDNGKLVVTGAATAKAASDDDATLAKAVTDYKAYVQKQADELTAATTTFVAALKAGDTQKAQDLFATTRSHYEAIEPIAESFGDLDPEIDARVNDVADSASWTGFHRIEQILFTRKTTKGTERYADKLLADVKDLQSKIAGLDLQASQIANGAVGLLDEVSASKITGEEDRYSHTDLTDFQANFDGARKAFETLEPALEERGDAALVKQIDERIAAVQTGLDKYRRPDAASGFAPYSELTDADRKQFSQQVAALAEPLSLVAGKVL